MFVRDGKRFIRITGTPGVGKSALAAHVLKFVTDRVSYKCGGIVYIDCRDIKDKNHLLTVLCNQIRNDSSGWFHSQTSSV
jgi:nucleoside-triphosphatase THEP1